MTPDRSKETLVDDELDVLAALVPIAGRDIVELGCGAAKLARSLMERHPDSRVTGLEVDERFFEMPVSFMDFADFEQRMMRPTFADHRIDDAKLAEVSAAFVPHMKTGGAHFTRPMHVRVLCKRA